MNMLYLFDYSFMIRTVCKYSILILITDNTFVIWEDLALLRESYTFV